jgi:GNAT superfamily N-acetyltransferase
MDLPDLPPDIRFLRLPSSDDGIRYSFDVKCAAMKEHIVKRWPWDESWQLRKHLEHFGEKPFFKISLPFKDIGTISFMRAETYLRFGEFYLFPVYQRCGIGTRVLNHCLKLADDACLPVRLEYLKWSPVGTLYRRHGFIDVGESDTHWLLERPSPTSKS